MPGIESLPISKAIGSAATALMRFVEDLLISLLPPSERGQGAGGRGSPKVRQAVADTASRMGSIISESVKHLETEMGRLTLKHGSLESRLSSIERDLSTLELSLDSVISRRSAPESNVNSGGIGSSEPCACGGQIIPVDPFGPYPRNWQNPQMPEVNRWTDHDHPA